jgi:hypothetical protein
LWHEIIGPIQEHFSKNPEGSTKRIAREKYGATQGQQACIVWYFHRNVEKIGRVMTAMNCIEHTAMDLQTP